MSPTVHTNPLILRSFGCANKVGSLPSSGVMLSRELERYYEPLRLPPAVAALSFPYTPRSVVSPPPQTGRKPRAINLREHADPATPGVDECHFRYSSTLPWPSPSDHRVGFSGSFTRLLIGSLALRPALLLFGNSRPRVTATPLPHATGAYGQLPGRDFNPLDSLLLLRMARAPGKAAGRRRHPGLAGQEHPAGAEFIRFVGYFPLDDEQIKV